MKCDICGKNNAGIRRITETHGRGSNLLVIENIPMVNCPDCGEGYFTAEVLHEIERIKLHHKNFTVKKKIEVAEYT
jgi:YgiT-type zinc finger domain-containing protein